MLASRGQRDLDEGPEQIVDKQELATVKRQGRKVVFSVLSTALLATALLLIPS